MKYSDVKPIHKTDDKTEKGDYRPIRILPNLRKIYEKIMYSQIYLYFNGMFFKFQ